MSSNSVFCKFLEDFACAHVSDGFMEDNGVRMLGSFMNIQGSPLIKVKELKDKGNCLFRQNYVDRAAACYDEACKLLSLSVGANGGDDVQSISTIAVSLNSNLAACALKLEEYQAALDLCSMILDTFPRNVKALFRRAIAFMKLKRFLEAELDLNEALVVEPRNKDVLRELAVVKGHLLMKENGKRSLEVAHVVNMDRNSKKHVHVSNSFESNKDFESENMDLDDQSICGVEVDRKEDKERVNMEVTDIGNSGMDLGTSLKKNEKSNSHTMSILEFSKRGGRSSRLRIPSQSYQKLLEGKELSFYHKRDLSTTSIRILNIETTKRRDITKESRSSRRRRRRRCPKRGSSKTMVDLKEDMTQLEIINDDPVVPCKSSRVSSLCDNSTSSNTQILQVPSKIAAHDSRLPISPVIDNATLNCHNAENGSKDQQPFSISPEKCKTFLFSFEKFRCGLSTPLFCRYPFNHHLKGKRKRRMITPKKDYSQEDESPRHSLSTCFSSRSFSQKFLRLRGVSVSCRRYSSEAQLMKKRKEMLAHLASSDRPLKKPTLFVAPGLSLISYSNNVIIKSDS